MVREGWTVTGRKVRIGRDESTIGRALISVYDKTGLDRPGRRAAQPRRRDRQHRQHRRRDPRRPGCPVTGGGGHPLPRVPGRPGEDAAPGRARRAAGRPEQARAREHARRARHRPRSSCWCPTCTRSRPTVSQRRLRRRSVSSRSTSAARPWCARPRRITRHVTVITDPAMYGAVAEAVTEAGSPWPSGADSPPGLSPGPLPTIARSRPGSPRGLRTGRGGAGIRLAGCGRRASGPEARCSATGKTRTSRPPCTAGGGRAAVASQRRPAARQGHVLQQLRGRCRRLAGCLRLRRAVRGHHQARQPVRHRPRRRPGRGAPQGARLRPGLRVWRGDRGQPAW